MENDKQEHYHEQEQEITHEHFEEDRELRERHRDNQETLRRLEINRELYDNPLE